MMRKLENKHNIESVFALLIFCAFCVAVLMVLILGAHVYKDIVFQNQNTQDQRIAVTYIEAKIRHNDTLDHIYVDCFKGYEDAPDIDTLYLEEDYDDRTYHTMIYWADGWVRELYCEKGIQFYPDDGIKVIEAAALHFTMDQQSGMLQISCTDKSGVIISINVFPRCMREAAL